ncbi:MAG: hypothetical protein ISS79_00005 [Phycisphaerae bacterium]|nr:hypothetical protein [Phycisphaerae bacterium]
MFSYKFTNGPPFGTAEAFLRTAEAISKIPDAAEQATAAYSMFGRQGTQLLVMLQQGRGGIEAMAKEAEKLGLVFSRVDAAKVEAANDALTRLKALITGALRQSVIQLSPYIESLVTSLVDTATAGEGMGSKIINVFESISLSVAKTTEWINTLLFKLKKLSDSDKIFKEIHVRSVARYREASGEAKAFERKKGFLGWTSVVQPENQVLFDAIKAQEKVKYEQEFIGGGSVGRLQAYFEKLRRMGKQKEFEFTTTQADKWLSAAPDTAMQRTIEDAERTQKTAEDAEHTQKIVEQAEQRALQFVQSIRSQQYLTSYERLEALRTYTEEHAASLEQQAEAHRILSDEIISVEKSQVNKLKVFQSKLRADMQNTGLYVGEKMASLAQSIEGSMSNAFVNMIQQGASFKDAMIGFALEVQGAFVRIAADMLARSVMGMALSALNPLGAIFSGGASAAAKPDAFSLAAAPHHWGGIVGPGSGGLKRRVPAALFMGAPRLHSGLMSDEFPAILQQGERVIPKGGGGMPAVQVNIHNETGAQMSAEASDVSFDGEQLIVDAVVRNYHQGREMHELITGRKS